MLWRPSHRHDQRPVFPLLQIALPELADLLEDRIRRFLQIDSVAAEGIVFPNVLCVPGAAGDVPLPAVAPEDVVRGAHRPAAGILEPLVSLCCLLAWLTETVDHPNERFVTFRQIRWFGQPVIHLDVDVRMVVRVPRRVVRVVPETLQVGRKASGT